MLVVIPARLGASRLSRKPLRLLGGAPLVVRVWERVTAFQLEGRCIVATDSDEVAQAVRRAGAEAVMTADRHPSGTDRVAEVAAMPRYAGCDVIVNVQGDEPFLSGEAVRGAAALVSSGRFPLGTAAAPLGAAQLDSPDVVKVVHADDGRAMYFSRAAIPFARNTEDRPARDRLARQHIGVYAYSRDALAQWVALPPHPLEQSERLEQLRPLAAGIAMGVARVSDAVTGQDGVGGGIDTEEDLERANALWPDFITGRA